MGEEERATSASEEDLLKIPDFSKLTTQELFALEDMPEFADQDSSGVGHRQLAHEREVLHYLRLIDGEMQTLQGMFLNASQTLPISPLPQPLDKFIILRLAQSRLSPDRYPTEMRSTLRQRRER